MNEIIMKFFDPGKIEEAIERYLYTLGQSYRFEKKVHGDKKTYKVFKMGEYMGTFGLIPGKTMGKIGLDSSRPEFVAEWNNHVKNILHILNKTKGSEKSIESLFRIKRIQTQKKTSESIKSVNARDLPSRIPDRNRWIQVWGLIETMAKNGDTHEIMYAWLGSNHSDLAKNVSLDTFRDIVNSGLTGKIPLQ